MLTIWGILTCLSGHAHEAAIEGSRIGILARGKIFTFFGCCFLSNTCAWLWFWFLATTLKKS